MAETYLNGPGWTEESSFLAARPAVFDDPRGRRDPDPFAWKIGRPSGIRSTRCLFFSTGASASSPARRWECLTVSRDGPTESAVHPTDWNGGMIRAWGSPFSEPPMEFDRKRGDGRRERRRGVAAAEFASCGAALFGRGREAWPMEARVGHLGGIPPERSPRAFPESRFLDGRNRGTARPAGVANGSIRRGKCRNRRRCVRIAWISRSSAETLFRRVFRGTPEGVLWPRPWWRRGWPSAIR